MEDLWKLRKIGYRSLSDVADRAEYDRMLQRFQSEEQKSNLKNLLYGEEKIVPPFARKKE